MLHNFGELTDCKSEKTKFIVPLNWSEQFINFVLEHSNCVKTIYGSLPDRPGGRPIPHTDIPNHQVPNLERLEALVETLRNKGIDFNLIMNATCTGNVYFSKAGKESLEMEIKTISDLGINKITVANLDLARRINFINPKIEIILSVIFNITELDQLFYLKCQDFNLKGLVIGKGLNRNFSKLANFIKKAGTIELTLVVNDFCPSVNCPIRISDHNNTCAHYKDSQPYMPPSLNCRKILMENPFMYLSAPVVNPNQLLIYEDIGINSFKITDRTMPDYQLINVCKAYFNRRFEGNYFRLFSYTSHYNKLPKGQRELSEEEMQEIIEKGYHEILSHKGSFVLQPYADAMALAKSDFLNFFEQGFCKQDCFHQNFNKSGCKHCHIYTEKYVQYDPSVASDILSNIKLLIEKGR